MRDARGVETVALLERMRARKARIDPRRERALEIGDERTPAAQQLRSRECGAREIRLNRPAKEVPEAGAGHSLRLPLACELREVTGSQEIGEIDLGHLEQLIPSNALQGNTRIRCARASGEGSVPHLEGVRERFIARSGTL
jgi:hypothetical protein